MLLLKMITFTVNFRSVTCNYFNSTNFKVHLSDLLVVMHRHAHVQLSVSPFSVVGYLYNPVYFAKVANTFKQHSLKMEESEIAGGSSTLQENQDDILTDDETIETSFQPRCVPLEALLGDPLAGCKQYEQLQQSPRVFKLFAVQLSHSMQFLLVTCAELIDIHIEDLYQSLLIVERLFSEVMCMSLRHVDYVLRKPSKTTSVGCNDQPNN